MDTSQQHQANCPSDQRSLLFLIRIRHLQSGVIVAFTAIPMPMHSSALPSNAFKSGREDSHKQCLTKHCVTHTNFLWLTHSTPSADSCVYIVDCTSRCMNHLIKSKPAMYAQFCRPYFGPSNLMLLLLTQCL